MMLYKAYELWKGHCTDVISMQYIQVSAACMVHRISSV